MGRLLFLRLLIMAIYYLARGIFAPQQKRTSGRASRRTRDAPPHTDLVQDPLCQLYVPKTDAVKRSIRGRTYYFCSRECADKFERA